MNDLQNDIEAVRAAMGETSERIAKSADTPRERLTLAVAGRNPEGFTEALAADVVAVGKSLTPEDYASGEYVKILVSSAVKNLHGARGVPLPEHRAKEMVAAFSTKALLELLQLSPG